ncbi:MAG TPA: nuclear transport factor 2 family protein [Steroidobacteraceae bacterium]|jgi:ketosteroid isomerase-like protein|nr:nuclear transport factor 2 family protein [Steroidobacteraceae bacterium]
MARITAGQVALTGIVALGAAWLAVAGAPAGDISTLTRLSDEWDKAIVRKDEKAIADNMAEDFRMIDGRGEVSAKKAFVADLVDPRLSIDPYTVEEFTVRLYGDTALLSGRTHMTGRYDDKPFESNYRYIDIYVRKGGSWKIVSVQITKFPPAKAD